MACNGLNHVVITSLAHEHDSPEAQQPGSRRQQEIEGAVGRHRGEDRGEGEGVCGGYIEGDSMTAIGN